MKTLKQLLAAKTRQLAVVAPSDTVFHALSVMAANDVGALLVLAAVATLAVAGAERILRKEINAQAHAELLTQLKSEL